MRFRTGFFHSGETAYSEAADLDCVLRNIFEFDGKLRVSTAPISAKWSRPSRGPDDAEAEL